MRRLIVNADDFGLTPGVNRAIVEAYNNGIVTSATLMANSSAFEEAVPSAAACPKLSVGCHIVLVDGTPLLAEPQVSTLIGSKKTTFRDSLTVFAAKALAGRLDPGQIEAEATAQIRKLQSAGIAVTHFDTHKHTHMFPAVLRALLRAAKACGIRALRNPFAPPRPLAASQVLRRPYCWKRYFEVRALSTLRSGFRRAVQDAGNITPDGIFGIVATGSLDLALFEAIVECIPDGTWEFVCHPGYNDADLRAVKTRLRESRAQELQVLTSAAAREMLSQHGVELISYRDLATSSS